MTEGYRLTPGRLVGGGAFCEGCGCYLKEGSAVFIAEARAQQVHPFLCCAGCRPPQSELPPTVISLEAAVVVEEPGSYREGALYEVREGSACRVCGHVFLLGEWLLVGATESLGGGEVYCPECREGLEGPEGLVEGE